MVLWIWKLVLFNLSFELMLLFTECFEIVLERFRSSLLHYRYTGGIVTVVRVCPETQLDYSNYGNGDSRKIAEKLLVRLKTNKQTIIRRCAQKSVDEGFVRRVFT
jgi:hypothetical protein